MNEHDRLKRGFVLEKNKDPGATTSLVQHPDAFANQVLMKSRIYQIVYDPSVTRQQFCDLYWEHLFSI